MTGALLPTHEQSRVLFQSLEQPYQFVSLTIPFKTMKVDEKFDPHAIESFFQTNKEQFRKPEFRSFTLLRFDRNKMKQDIVVDESEVHDAFERTKDSYHTSEKRHVESISLPNNDLVKKAMDHFRMGKPLKTIARELKGIHRDIGTIAKVDMPEEQGDAIFQAPVGSMTKPFDTTQGWTIFIVTKIIPSHDKTFEMVRDDIHTSLQNEKFNTHFETIQNEIEDALAGGESMQAIADKYHLVIENVRSMDKQGQDEEGKKILEDVIAKDAADYVFTHDTHATSSVIMAKPLADSSLMAFVIRVDGVRPSYIPELKDIHDTVKTAFQNHLRNQKALELAKNISKGIASVDDLKKQGERHQLSFTMLPAFSRSTMTQETLTKQNLGKDTVEDMFALPEGEVLIAPAKEGVKLVMVKGKLPFTVDMEKQKKFSAGMQHMLREDFQHALRYYLRHHEYPVTINASQVEHVVGHSS